MPEKIAETRWDDLEDRIDELRVYDEAVQEHFAIQYGEKTLVPLFMPPQRAFATVKAQYNEDDKRMPFPAISLLRTGVELDMSRFNAALQVKVRRFEKTKDFLIGRYPLPVRISYTLTGQTVTMSSCNRLQKIIVNKTWGDIGYVTVNLGEWGKKYFSYEVGSMSDISEAQPGEEERKLGFEVEVYLNAMFFGDTVYQTGIQEGLKRIPYPTGVTYEIEVKDPVLPSLSPGVQVRYTKE